MARKQVQGYSLDAALVEELRAISSASEVPASRLVNAAVADFLQKHKAGSER
jgi:hypothetical protein